MKLTCFLVAEYAAVSNDNKLTIAGTIDSVEVRLADARGAALPPIPMPGCYLAAQLEFSLSDGLQHAAQLRVIDEDANDVAAPVELPGINCSINPYGRPMTVNIIMRLQGLTFPGPGDFAFELRVDGRVVGSAAMYITDTTAQGQ